MVLELFGVQPDAWQVDVLDTFPHRRRQALLASKGVGKTALLAWLCWNFLLTRPNAKIAATSITGDNLRDGLWTEMALWQSKSPMLKAAFEWSKERIVCKEAASTWWMSARAWSKAADSSRQADTLAGLHADYMMFVLDEVGGIPDAVMAAAEAGLASGVESHIVMAGNPTHLEGPLYRAATAERDLWDVVSINADPEDPKRSPRVSEAWAREQIAKYGADNPWVLVNVYGRFPPGSLNTLLGPDEVRAAMERMLPRSAYEFSAKVLGVDVARQGDDRSVIFRRQGLWAKERPRVMRIPDSYQVAGAVAHETDEWSADAIMVDATGGYGAGVVDALRTMGRRSIEVQFAGAPNKAMFVNKRAEMWWEMAEWIKGGGSLPDEPSLVRELTAPTYSFKGDKILIEPKDLIKQRVGESPDMADALACTFAQSVAPKGIKVEDRYRPRRRSSKAGVWAG